MNRSGEVLAVSISTDKGTKKSPIECAVLKVDHGIEGDAHAGEWPRQVSLLSEESIDKMRASGLEINYGDFAENITVRGITLHTLPPGTRITVGEVLLEVTQIGKECHSRCEIYRQVGDCVMPREGIFARVLHGGEVRRGDRIEVMP